MSRASAITFRGVERRFGGVVALKGIDLEISEGSVHALVGENGAGKSTALGLIAGRISPSRGRVEVLGQDITGWSPRAAREHGVAAIYQELTIVPALRPTANVFLGNPVTKRGLLAEREMRRRYAALCEEFGVASAPDVPCEELSVAQQQLLEIMRALSLRPRVILFDEPTASLAEAERSALHELIRKLRDDGLTVVFVSHNLDEVLELADQVTVFRDGEVVVTAPSGALTKAALVRSMLGHELPPGDRGSELVDVLEAEVDEIAHAQGFEGTYSARRQAPVLRAQIDEAGRLRDIELEVHAGEIVGIAGLVGSGRTTLLRALAGAHPGAKGHIRLNGSEHRLPKSPRIARRLGIAQIPEDRKGQGLAMGLSAADNVALGAPRAAARGGLMLTRRRVESVVAPVLEPLRFDRRRIGSAASTLSGGNQQKLLVARWQYSRPTVLLVDEPTRGVDVGAKAEILAALRASAREHGTALLLVSSELEEVIAVSDRILVLAHGSVIARVDAGPDTTAEQLLHLAFGTRSDAPGSGDAAESFGGTAR